jgi:CDP-diacylglycerol pyrophosphatase
VKPRPPLLSAVISIAIVAALAAFWLVPMVSGSRSALWRIVHGRCVPNQQVKGRPAPCEYVNLTGGEKNGYAVFKDRVGKTQFLLIPTRRLSGIDDPAILASDAPNYWQAAWDARPYLFQRAGRTLPRNAVGMAINSTLDRSQDQFHIHIDCVRTQVSDRLGADLGEIGDSWEELPFNLAGHTYAARRVESSDLHGVDPFQLLSLQAAKDGHGMGNRTLVVLGATFPGDHRGFVLLSDAVNVFHADLAHGEDLLDHGCAIAGSTSHAKRS